MPFFKQQLFNTVSAQHRVQWTLGILAKSQAVFYTSAFFRSDGFAPSAPAPVMQTVGQALHKGIIAICRKIKRKEMHI
jgi:hypothetical protein